VHSARTTSNDEQRASDRAFRSTLAAARTGDEAAWEQLYRDLAPAVVGYLRFSGAPEPEDLAGEVFLHVVRDLEGFEGGARQFRGWVLSIARHRLLDDHRYRGRRPVDPVADEALLAAAPAGDAEAEALERLGEAEVLRLIGRLSRDQQDVLLLRLVGDLTVEEISVAIGKRPGAVKALQRRGLRTVAKSIER
jgi:RNA polymerase sigma factor (sigma-70 family)